ncbi:RluA family pseudouridine synthase [bacterium]|nr:MAG: RluA family pseudouridine synthase [bacterium]
MEITAQADYPRLDSFLAGERPELSRSRIHKLIAGGLVTFGGRVLRPSRKVARGETFRVELPEPEPSSALPEELALDVLYEDEDIIAIAKPRGLVVHPSPGHPSGTVVNALLHRVGDLSGIGGVLRPGIVHRLDKDTSGVLLVAKNDAAHRSLQEKFKSREMEKVYLAVVLGNLSGEGVIDAPIGRHPADRKKMAVNAPRSRSALTRWKALIPLKGATLLEVVIETGRTHQIRVHLASTGHPVVGDPLYGGVKRAKGIADYEARRRLSSEKMQALHAWKLSFRHPSDGREITLTAPLPSELAALIRALGGEGWPLEDPKEAR